MAPAELLVGLAAGALGASVLWGLYCRRLREQLEREARRVRRGRSPADRPRAAGLFSPVAPSLAAPPVAESAPLTRASQRLTVLVVEPGEDNRRRLAEHLGRRGHRVVTAGEVEQGLDMARRLRFDLIFVAAEFPGLDWLEVWEQFRPLTGTVTLLISSAEGAQTLSVGGFELPVLRQPVNPVELERLLNQVESRRA